MGKVDLIISTKDILLGIANFILLSVLIVILIRLSNLDQEFQAQRIKERRVCFMAIIFY